MDRHLASNPPWAKRALIALRPWACFLSIVPVLWGTALAVLFGNATFRPGLAGLALLAMAVLHHASNMLNDVGDFRAGVDTRTDPASGAIVRGFFSVRQIFSAACVLMGVGTAIGLYIAWRVGPVILLIGGAGILTGIVYTLGPWTLKRHALGDLAVFVAFGLLGSLGAWTVQTGSPAWLPVIWAIPFSLLVTAVLHANNWRDMSDDERRNIHTIAGLLGNHRAAWYYFALIFSAYGLIVLLVFAPRLLDIGTPMPYAMLLVFLSLPSALKVFRLAQDRYRTGSACEELYLDGRTAQLSMLFGLLSLAAIGLHALFNVMKG